MAEVATSQGKFENEIYSISQGKSSLFDKKNQIFLRPIEKIIATHGDQCPIWDLRIFPKKLMNHEQMNIPNHVFTTRKEKVMPGLLQAYTSSSEVAGKHHPAWSHSYAPYNKWLRGILKNPVIRYYY